MAMRGYWWECCNSKCSSQKKISGPDLVRFLWKLANKDWDQRLLVKRCRGCGQTIRLAYEFPKKVKKRAKLIVVHLVGLKKSAYYLPMMWEVIPSQKRKERWFDFKYVGGLKGKNPAYGLSRPAVFSQEDLRKLFALYAKKLKQGQFP